VALKDVSAIAKLADDPHQLGILAQAEHSFPNPTIPEMSAFWSAAGPMHEAVWEGLMTSEEASVKALKDFESALMMSDQ